MLEVLLVRNWLIWRPFRRVSGSPLFRKFWAQSLLDLSWLAGLGLIPVLLVLVLLVARTELDRARVLVEDGQFALYSATLVGAAVYQFSRAGGIHSFRWYFSSAGILGALLLLIVAVGFFTSASLDPGETSLGVLTVSTLAIYGVSLVLVFVAGLLAAEVDGEEVLQEYETSGQDLTQELRRRREAQP